MSTTRTSVERRLQFDGLRNQTDAVCMKVRSGCARRGGRSRRAHLRACSRIHPNPRLQARMFLLEYWTECCENSPDMERLNVRYFAVQCCAPRAHLLR